MYILNIYNQIKSFIYNHKYKILAISSLLFLSIIVTSILIIRHNTNENILAMESSDKIESVDKNLEEDEVEEIKEENKPVEYFFVDIKGQVHKPGVYSLEKGKRVVDAINQAGGLKADANTKLLNLSKEIFDQMVIIVYSNSEISDLTKLKETETKESAICTKTIINDACTNVSSDSSNNNDTTSSNQLIININSATIEDLSKLPKIGEAKAKSIIEYRDQNGKFEKIEDIKNVSGIGDSLFESIKENITV